MKKYNDEESLDKIDLGAFIARRIGQTWLKEPYRALVRTIQVVMIILTLIILPFLTYLLGTKKGTTTPSEAYEPASATVEVTMKNVTVQLENLKDEIAIQNTAIASANNKLDELRYSANFITNEPQVILLEQPKTTILPSVLSEVIIGLLVLFIGLAIVAVARGAKQSGNGISKFGKIAEIVGIISAIVGIISTIAGILATLIPLFYETPICKAQPTPSAIPASATPSSTPTVTPTIIQHPPTITPNAPEPLEDRIEYRLYLRYDTDEELSMYTEFLDTINLPNTNYYPKEEIGVDVDDRKSLWIQANGEIIWQYTMMMPRTNWFQDYNIKLAIYVECKNSDTITDTPSVTDTLTITPTPNRIKCEKEVFIPNR